MKYIYILLISFVLPAYADMWLPPVNYKIFSGSKHICLEIVSSTIMQVDKDMAEEPCKGYIYYRCGIDSVYQLVDSIKMVNALCPTTGYIFDNGKYFVTFDNWGSIGYGENVIVLYDSLGKLIKNYSLEDIFPDRILDKFPRSLSSRFWKQKFWFDEDSMILYIKSKTIKSGFWKGKEYIDTFDINLLNGKLKSNEPYKDK